MAILISQSASTVKKPTKNAVQFKAKKKLLVEDDVHESEVERGEVFYLDETRAGCFLYDPDPAGVFYKFKITKKVFKQLSKEHTLVVREQRPKPKKPTQAKDEVTPDSLKSAIQKVNTFMDRKHIFVEHRDVPNGERHFYLYDEDSEDMGSIYVKGNRISPNPIREDSLSLDLFKLFAEFPGENISTDRRHAMSKNLLIHLTDNKRPVSKQVADMVKGSYPSAKPASKPKAKPVSEIKPMAMNLGFSSTNKPHVYMSSYKAKSKIPIILENGPANRTPVTLNVGDIFYMSDVDVPQIFLLSQQRIGWPSVEQAKVLKQNSTLHKRPQPLTDKQMVAELYRLKNAYSSRTDYKIYNSGIDIENMTVKLSKVMTSRNVATFQLGKNGLWTGGGLQDATPAAIQREY